jgi:hypothetical protein
MANQPSCHAGSAVSAALTPSRKTKLCGEVLAEPQIGAIRSTWSGNSAAQWNACCPHREAVNQRYSLDTEHLRQQPLLHSDIVGHREMRVTAAVERRRRVARRG